MILLCCRSLAIFKISECTQICAVHMYTTFYCVNAKSMCVWICERARAVIALSFAVAVAISTGQPLCERMCVWRFVLCL